jgi:2-keto-4-pentenoate hydratase
VTGVVRDHVGGSVASAADRLREAARTGTPCVPVRDLIGPSDVAAAYAVQQRLTDARVAGGAVVIGRKIGLTAAAVQQQLGVDQPDFGVLFADMVCREDEPIPISRLLQPKIEAEVAFVLAQDLSGGPFDKARVRAAVAYAVAALEVVDSRIAGWDISLADTVADNASSGLLVLGADRKELDDFEPGEALMSMARQGEVVSQGSGAACLGDPLNALAWLAEKACDLGQPLRAGDLVLSGALGPMVAVREGDAFAADISGLGTVRASFSGTASR